MFFAWDFGSFKGSMYSSQVSLTHLPLIVSVLSLPVANPHGVVSFEERTDLVIATKLLVPWNRTFASNADHVEAYKTVRRLGAGT